MQHTIRGEPPQPQKTWNIRGKKVRKACFWFRDHYCNYRLLLPLIIVKESHALTQIRHWLLSPRGNRAAATSTVRCLDHDQGRDWNVSVLWPCVLWQISIPNKWVGRRPGSRYSRPATLEVNEAKWRAAQQLMMLWLCNSELPNLLEGKCAKQVKIRERVRACTCGGVCPSLAEMTDVNVLGLLDTGR